MTVSENRKVSCSTSPNCWRRSAFFTLADILSVDADAAAVDIVEAGQQVDDGGLAGAGRAHQGDGFPSFGLQASYP